MKRCSKCKLFKSYSSFYSSKNRSDGLRAYCKKCGYVKKREALPENMKRCSVCKKIKTHIEFYKRKEGKFGVESRCKECEEKRRHTYYQKNKKILTAKELNRYRTDMQFRAIKHARARVNNFLKSKSRFSKTLGCTFEEFKKHIESLFQPGMTWGNYGQWEIDHIECLSLSYIKGPLFFAKACCYKNLQPLWIKDHVAKTVEDVRLKKMYENGEVS